MAADKAVPRQRFTGQDFSITVIVDGKTETVGPFKHLSMEIVRDLDDDIAEPTPPIFGTITMTGKMEPNPTFWAGMAAMVAQHAERTWQAVLDHQLRGGLFLHPRGFLARIYTTRMPTGHYVVRTRGASIHGDGPVACTRRRYRTPALARREVERLLRFLMVVPGEDRPIDAVPLFAARDGSSIETVHGPVTFSGQAKCQTCGQRGAIACKHECGAVLCSGCNRKHLDSLEELIAEFDAAERAEYAEAQGQIMHDIRAAEPRVIGDVVSWNDVPPGALVRETKTRLLTLRVGDRGMSVGGRTAADVEPFNDEKAWEWCIAIGDMGQASDCTILALGLTGQESAAELVALAGEAKPC